MNTPIKLWPPGGGDYIQVLPDRVECMTSKGWTEKKPEAKKKTAQKNEVSNNGES